ncbi:sensor histidine kinase [Brevundimonas lutea]|uniref:sensor histidine kinase n=1 Tax=Brevundimonas lutea TaxID=2293980 RepID=UPI001F0C483A|nr:histidine kinase dimerization/phosphoacceptor domain -containing protein [Brevundimonas lutea]
MNALAPPSDIATNLALSLIAASVAPVLLLDEELTIVAASVSFRDAFNVGFDDIPGARLADLGDGEWNTPQLWSLLKATAYGQASITAYEMELQSAEGPKYLVLNAQRLDSGIGQGIRLLLSIQDVTEMRASDREKDALVRDKAILVQEMQHRIANSLQIIASVLMQSVRKVGADESRDHLLDAHQRIMSVAAVQRQLTKSTLGDVELRGYFADLCRSIGDSMIRDHNRLRLTASVDDSVANSGKAVSLGLIVTELVINALKHAFPKDREGQITVDYRAIGPGWVLTVCDDGVGMPRGAGSPKPGLGTGIITALATQLGAVIQIVDAKPGVRASITCDPSLAHSS